MGGAPLKRNILAKQLVDGIGDGAELRNKLTIVVEETHDDTDLVSIGGWGHGSDSVAFSGGRRETPLRDLEPQKVQGVGGDSGLGWMNAEVAGVTHV